MIKKGKNLRLANSSQKIFIVISILLTTCLKNEPLNKTINKNYLKHLLLLNIEKLLK